MENKRKFDRLKNIKRMSREENQVHGKGGVHKDKKDKRNRRLRTKDFLLELEEESENILDEEEGHQPTAKAVGL